MLITTVQELHVFLEAKVWALEAPPAAMGPQQVPRPPPPFSRQTGAGQPPRKAGGGARRMLLAIPLRLAFSAGASQAAMRAARGGLSCLRCDLRCLLSSWRCLRCLGAATTAP